MKSLTVLYDSRCSLCQWATQWLTSKPMFIDIQFVAAASSTARAMFPNIDHEATLRDITAIDDDGYVYQNEKAWVMCLWCTEQYRPAAIRLASPRMLPMTKRFVRLVSRYRPLEDDCAGDFCAI